jgi:hypothetical protein
MWEMAYGSFTSSSLSSILIFPFLFTLPWIKAAKKIWSGQQSYLAVEAWWLNDRGLLKWWTTHLESYKEEKLSSVFQVPMDAGTKLKCWPWGYSSHPFGLSVFSIPFPGLWTIINSKGV